MLGLVFVDASLTSTTHPDMVADQVTPSWQRRPVLLTSSVSGLNVGADDRCRLLALFN